MRRQEMPVDDHEAHSIQDNKKPQIGNQLGMNGAVGPAALIAADS